MSAPPPQAWLNALLTLLQQAQLGLLQLWHLLGLTDEVHGQPAWPWARRIAGETLLIDLGLARQLAWSLLAVAFALLCVVLALLWRRRRLACLGAGALALVIAPWPSPALLLTAAAPTSFHRSPTQFSIDAIATGARIYATHCVACHGDDGRGEGAQSVRLSTWPPTFASPLLGRRAEGELFWHIVAGMRDARGRMTMPAFGNDIDDTQTWAVIDYLKTLAAGTGAAMQGNWPIPLQLPDVSIQCTGAPPRSLADWRGQQRVRVVAFDGAASTLPLEDPRFVTLLVTRDGQPLVDVPAFRAGCVASSRNAWQVFAQLAGVDTSALAGTAFLADRNGWLRARSSGGSGKQNEWGEDDLLCTAGQVAQITQMARKTSQPDGLTALLLRMDAEPVRFVQGGFVH